MLESGLCCWGRPPDHIDLLQLDLYHRPVWECMNWVPFQWIQSSVIFQSSSLEFWPSLGISPWEPIKASLKSPHFSNTPLVWRWGPQHPQITSEKHSSRVTTAHADQVHYSLLLSENFRLRTEEEGLGLEKTPAPSEQDGHNSLQPQSTAATKPICRHNLQDCFLCYK